MTDADIRARAETLYASFAHRTGFLIHWAHRRSHRALNEALRPLGLEVRHVSVLAVLARKGPRTQRELIDLLVMDKSSMVYVVDALEKKGLAKRKPAPGDRRAHSVHITAPGRARLAEAMTVIEGVNDTLYGFLSEEELARFHQTLWKLLENEPRAGAADAAAPAVARAGRASSPPNRRDRR